MCVSGCDFWCIFPVPFVLRLCLRRPVLDREASGVESKYLVVVRPVITHNAGWGTSLAWGPEGYETILLLILFKMAASCLSGHLPVCLSVCVSHLCKIWCSRADVQLVYGNSILPYLIASSSRPPSHDSLYEPSPLTPTVFHAPCYSFWFCVCVCVLGNLHWFFWTSMSWFCVPHSWVQHIHWRSEVVFCPVCRPDDRKIDSS